MTFRFPDVPEITVGEFVREFDSDSVQVVDVREDDEWQAGHIPGSVHIPLGHLAARLAELEPGTTVVAICHSGVRSLYAAEILRQAGFRDARSLRGGIVAWAEADQALTV